MLHSASASMAVEIVPCLILCCKIEPPLNWVVLSMKIQHEAATCHGILASQSLSPCVKAGLKLKVSLYFSIDSALRKLRAVVSCVVAIRGNACRNSLMGMTRVVAMGLVVNARISRFDSGRQKACL